jgi:DNA adenine methylase
MGYFGSKAQAGVWQRIICQMPAHSFYVEPFFGSGQIFFRKRPAVLNVIIDADGHLIKKLRADPRVISGVEDRRPASKMTLTPAKQIPAVRVICGDALLELAALKPALHANAVIYCDPPYLFSSRTSRHRYAHEFGRDDQHAALLALLQGMNCRVLISGYPSKLYAEKLKSWRCISYQTRTRGRTVTECLWCNFPEPTELHDWRFIGKGYRERLTLKRFAARFLARLDAMPELKRNFVLNLVHQRHL